MMRALMRVAVIGLLCLLLAAPVLVGCQITHRDETRIAEAQARTDQARYQSLETEAKAAAAVGVAQADSQTQIVREQEKTTRATAWLGVLPWLLGIAILCVGLVGAAWLVLWFRGRAHLVMVQARAAGMLPAPQPRPALPRPPEVRSDRALPGPVARRAQATGTKPVQQGSCWLLVDVGGDVVEVMERRRA